MSTAVAAPDMAPGAVAAVLAAGRGERFGGGKLLAPLCGRPLVTWPVRAALASGLERVLVVLGDRAPETAQALPADPRLSTLVNPDHEQGMGGSLALAAAWARQQGASVLVVLLGDQPLVQPATVAQVARAALASPAGAAAARAGGVRAHPVALASRHFHELSHLRGDQGGRAILARLDDGVALVDAPDHSALDVDRPGDLVAALKAAEPLLAWAAPGPISRALGLVCPQVVAIAGSGGKTSLMYRLAGELARAGEKVAVTTTTRIHPPAAAQAAGPWLLGDGLPTLEEIERRRPPGLPLCLAARRTVDGKLAGLSPAQIQRLDELPGLWLLAEADGAAGKPLKGWADHEPVVPARTSLLVVVAGASGLGRPLGGNWAHRPEAFAAGGGIDPGRPITPSALARVLCGPLGPLKALPPGARAALVVNQAESAAPADLAALRDELAHRGAYGRLLKASLRQGRLELWESD